MNKARRPSGKECTWNLSSVCNVQDLTPSKSYELQVVCGPGGGLFKLPATSLLGVTLPYLPATSGKSIDDKILDAHVLYREQNKSSFKSQGVWSILRHSPKWFESLASKKGNRKRRNGSSDTIFAEGATCHDQAEIERPVGKKTAKKTQDVERSLFDLVVKLASETEIKNRLLKEATSEQIMARSLAGMTATQRRYYELKQEQILKDLQSELGSAE
ncbi:hypothetical protein PR002_g12476 [Phytophthora rubi]|uniref:No apical meristem-associated C-terminal domain-containing protein n=1 Tax=Phytophthora rubi TaxID=129364 RepID=A0A6A3LWH2_9STRA|nr:hypothetical protein PR002_g12476 [Phytophthora rubi]